MQPGSLTRGRMARLSKQPGVTDPGYSVLETALEIEVSGEFRAKQRHQLGVHELKVVRNAQRNRRLAGNFFRETFTQPVRMLALHAEDMVCPAEVAGGDLDPGAVFRAGATGFIARMILKEGLGGRRTPPVGRADEEELGLQ